MAVPEDLFGEAYLDVESFRDMAVMFGAGMSLACDFPDDTPGNARLLRVLQAASRQIDTHCGRDFSPADRLEQHELDLSTWKFTVNNPPVSSVSACLIRYAISGTVTIPTANIYINNQKKFLEISRTLDGSLTILDAIGSEFERPVIEVTYKSVQDVPKTVQLACGFQAGHLINSGFVDKMLPPNFGKIDMGGLSVNNKKGYRSAEEMRAGSLSADAERCLTGEVRFVAS